MNYEDSITLVLKHTIGDAILFRARNLEIVPEYLPENDDQVRTAYKEVKEFLWSHREWLVLKEFSWIITRFSSIPGYDFQGTEFKEGIRMHLIKRGTSESCVIFDFKAEAANHSLSRIINRAID